MIVVKSECYGDIRRFTLPEQATFFQLKEIISNLYHLEEFTILHKNQSLEIVLLKTEEDFQKALKQNQQPIFRLQVVKIDPLMVSQISETKEQGPIPIKQSIPLETVQSVPEKQVSRTEISFDRETLKKIVTEVVTSDPFIDLLIDRITPQLKKINSSQEIQSPPQDIQSPPQEIQSPFQERKEYPEIKPKETRPQKIESLGMNDQEDINVPPKEISLFDSLIDSIPQATTEITKVLEGILQIDEKPEVKIDNKPEKMDKPHESSASPTSVEKDSEVLAPFKSFLSIFNKSFHKEPSPKVVKEEEPLPNQEELLTKLHSMGFTNREANLKALRFHKNYNEGLDEVVEDLLQQSQEKND